MEPRGASLGSAAAQPATVEGTGDPNIDVSVVQAAVENDAVSS